MGWMGGWTILGWILLSSTDRRASMTLVLLFFLLLLPLPSHTFAPSLVEDNATEKKMTPKEIDNAQTNVTTLTPTTTQTNKTNQTLNETSTTTLAPDNTDRSPNSGLELNRSSMTNWNEGKDGPTAVTQSISPDIEFTMLRVEAENVIYRTNGLAVLSTRKELKTDICFAGKELWRVQEVFRVNHAVRVDCGRNPVQGKLSNRRFTHIGENSSTILTAEFDFKESGIYTFCYKAEGMGLMGTGTEAWQSLEVVRTDIATFDFVWRCLLLLFLLFLSGLFSGLNLGLMTLDTTELKLIQELGNAKEKKYAGEILPIREQGNYLLCTLLIGNTFVNVIVSLLTSDLIELTDVSDRLHFLLSSVIPSICIVFLGEIIPQALCQKMGLAIGAKTHYLTIVFMVLTLPLSLPLSKCLDKLLGKDVARVYDREKLRFLVKSFKDEEDIGIIKGALDFGRKRAREKMKDIDEAFMVDWHEELNTALLLHILGTGYTRIPVFDSKLPGPKSQRKSLTTDANKTGVSQELEMEQRQNIVGMLMVKDLVLFGVERKMKVAEVCKMKERPVKFVMEETPLSALLKDLMVGQSHLALVVKFVTSPSSGGPRYLIIGLITLEDIIEEIIKADIIDETDPNAEDKHTTRKRFEHAYDVPRIAFARKSENVLKKVDEAARETVLWLSENMKEFSPTVLETNALTTLVEKNIEQYKEEYFPGNDRNAILSAKTPAKHFILIVDGSACVLDDEPGSIPIPTPKTPPRWAVFGYEVLREAFGKLAKLRNHETLSVTSEIQFLPTITLLPSTGLTIFRITGEQYVSAVLADQSRTLSRSRTYDEDLEESLSELHAMTVEMRGIVKESPSTGSLRNGGPRHSHSPASSQGGSHRNSDSPPGSKVGSKLDIKPHTKASSRPSETTSQ